MKAFISKMNGSVESYIILDVKRNKKMGGKFNNDKAISYTL